MSGGPHTGALRRKYCVAAIQAAEATLGLGAGETPRRQRFVEALLTGSNRQPKKPLAVEVRDVEREYKKVRKAQAERAQT